MKRLKFISVLFTIAMCMSLITTPVSVLAEDSTAPSESQFTEPAESKESEITQEKEMTSSSDKKPEPSKEKETASETVVTESAKETESPEPSKESADSNATEPSESGSMKADETKITETTGSDKKAPAESEDSGNTPKESSGTSVVEGKSPSQSDSSRKKTAVSGNCGDNLTWTLEDGTLTISGSGDMNSYFYYVTPWKSYRESITSIVFSGNITSIGDCAFEYFESLESITIPDSVNKIGDYAFRSCKKLVNVKIPNGITTLSSTFEDCTALTYISIPEGVTDLYGTFYNCNALESIDLPSSLKTIYGQTFFKCTNLSKISIPNGVTTIGNQAFSHCSSLKEITIPKSVTTIKWFGAFSYCSSLTSIEIPDGIKEIEEGTFEGCSSLKSVTFSKSITRFMASAFNECPSITDVYYGGTEDEWNNLPVYVGNDDIYKAKIYFNNSKLDIESSSLIIAVGGKHKLLVSGANDILFKTSNKKIAKVSNNGTISALKVGTATITAYSKSDPSKTATCKVAVKYRIKYVLNGGTNSSNNPEWYSNNRVYLKKPTRTGYVFKMWYKKSKGKQKKVGSVKKENITLYAKWAPITYTIKYKGNFLFAGSQKDQTCKYNTVYKIAGCSIKHSGYRFEYWTTNSDGTGTTYSKGDSVSNLTTKNKDVINLYAQWDIAVYDIKYDIPADVSNNNPNTYTKFDETIKLKSPSREGYDFLYWYTKGTKKVYDKKKKKYKSVDTENKISAINSGSTGNKTIYAKWKAHTYRIDFDANGGTGKMSPMKDCVYGKEFPLTKNNFTAPKDMIFAGWNTKSDGSGTSYNDCAKVKNLIADKDGSVTLYAKWEPDNKLYWPVRDSNGNSIKTLSNHFMQNGHKGIDIAAPAGSRWYAAYSGKVVKVFTGCSSNGYDTSHSTCDPHCNGEPNSARTYLEAYVYDKWYKGYYCNNGFGNGVVIEAVINGTTYYIQYAHMETVDTANIKAGMEIKRGTYLGTVGDRGCSFGTHAHFEIDKDKLFGDPVNNDLPENGGIFEYYD